MVVQVNGKVRDRIEVAPDIIGEDEAEALALASAGGGRGARRRRRRAGSSSEPPKLVNVVV